MSFKTGLIIAISVLVTIVLMNNQDEVKFWIFGDVGVSKLVVLGVMFLLGFILGVMSFRKKKQAEITYQDENLGEPEKPASGLSDEDRAYIS